jgi:hypothetical protein
VGREETQEPSEQPKERVLWVLFSYPSLSPGSAYVWRRRHLASRHPLHLLNVSCLRQFNDKQSEATGWKMGHTAGHLCCVVVARNTVARAFIYESRATAAKATSCVAAAYCGPCVVRLRSVGRGRSHDTVHRRESVVGPYNSSTYLQPMCHVYGCRYRSFPAVPPSCPSMPFAHWIFKVVTGFVVGKGG